MKKGIGWVLLGLLVLGMLPLSGAAGSSPVNRIFGADRYQTATAISRAGWDSSRTVVLARGDDFADALAGVPLAYSLDAPILLTGKNKLNEATKAEIERLGATHAVLLGGPQALDPEIVTSLKALGLTVERVHGQDRYETAALIARRLTSHGISRVFLASGLNFPDALAAAPYAAAQGSPILLSGETMPSITRNLLAEYDEVIVIGGECVIGDVQIKGLPATRLGGADRYETALALLRHFSIGEQVYVASGRDFADAITGAVLAAKEGTGVMLADVAVLPGYQELLAWAKSAVVLGGENSVSQKVVTELDRIFKDSDAYQYPGIVSAVSRSNTEIVLVLEQAPLRHLTAADFLLQPELEVLSVTTNNNVVTLVTEPQSPIKYKVTGLGGTCAYIQGRMAPGETGGISSISLENMRVIKVEFTKPVLWEDCRLLRNYYIGLAGEGTGNLQAASLTALLGSEWEVVRDQGGKYVDYVYIQSTCGLTVTNSLRVTYGTVLDMEVRNIREESGGYIHTSRGTFCISDVSPPKVEGVKAEDGHLVVAFDEPLGIGYSPARGFAVYINGRILSTEDLAEEGDIISGGTVPQQKRLVFDLGEYEPGQYSISVVGAKDLRGNLQAPNPWNGTFSVFEESGALPDYARPQVTEIRQTADNVLEILFDRPGVRSIGPGPVVTIKNAILSGNAWHDLVINADEADSIDMLETWGDGCTKWVVAYPAVYSLADGSGFTFIGNMAFRDVVVENYYATANPPGLEGRRTVFETQFIFDCSSPVVSGSDYDIETGTLYIMFRDEPFGGNVQAGTGLIRVSRTDEQGITYAEYHAAGSSQAMVPSWAADGSEPFQYMQLQLTKSGKLTDSAGRLLEGSVYTVELPMGAVTDANRLEVVGQTAEMKVASFNPLAATEMAIAIAPPLPAREGRVPQTAAGLIQSGWDMKLQPTAVTLQEGSTVVGSIEYMTRRDNLSKIIVVFDGQVNEASAVNKLNYSLNGNPLPAEAELEYFTQTGLNANVYGTDGRPGGEVGFVLISLPANSIPVSGSYLLMVENVCNYAGKKMLPVTAVVRLADNTQPEVKAIRSLGSREIEVQFNEPVVITSGKAVDNFLVFIDGLSYEVETIAPSGSNRVFLTLVQDVEEFTSITVFTAKDRNGFIWIEDVEGNILLSGQVITENE